MKATVPVIFSLLVFGAAGTAQAETMRGRIDTVDVEANQLKLKNGVRFVYRDDVDETQLAKGARVKLTYSKVKGQLRVKRLRVIGAPRG